MDQPADQSDASGEVPPVPGPASSGHDEVWAATTATSADPLGARTLVVDDGAGEADDAPPARPAKVAKPQTPLRAAREWLTVLVVALGAAVLIRVFVFQQYYIDGPSMQHTLEPHDRVLVNKLSYKLHDVHRGDVVVFDRVRGTTHDDLIKRVIGLPGETVEIRSCIVFIDGQQLDEPYLSTEIQSQPTPTARCRIPDKAPLVVPDGEVFVMGDNRPQSYDSREFGPIDIDLIRGRAFVIIWPVGHIGWL